MHQTSLGTFSPHLHSIPISHHRWRPTLMILPAPAYQLHPPSWGQISSLTCLWVPTSQHLLHFNQRIFISQCHQHSFRWLKTLSPSLFHRRQHRPMCLTSCLAQRVRHIYLFESMDCMNWSTMFGYCLVMMQDKSVWQRPCKPLISIVSILSMSHQ